ncbi:MAG: amino acid permease [Bacteroidetes bacterium]|nr:amino acid permease [Bacteroidota bacterium]
MNKPDHTNRLLRNLGLLSTIMIVAGSMIGSGIFRKPSSMAQQLHSPELMIIIWIAAGLITLIGAAINAEIAGIITDTGGQFIYFKKMYGDFIAYLYGWSVLSVIQTGSQAAIAYVFAEYIGYFIKYPQLPYSVQKIALYMPLVGDIYPFADFGTKAVAIICTLFLTGVNYFGVIFGGVVQNVVTIIKILSILLLTVLLLFLGDGNTSNFTKDMISGNSNLNLFSGIGLALAGAFWAYDGWNNVTFIAGEVKNPKRDVGLGLLFGTLIVIIVYVLLNIAFLYVLPINEIALSPLIGATAAEKIFGHIGGEIISIAVIVSTFGALNGSILATARVQYAMSEKKLFFKSLAKIHPRYKTPHVSLIVLGIWSSVLVLSGSFDMITDYVIFAAWMFYMLGAFGVFVLRKKMKDTDRTYKVWGYPYTPALFVLFSFVFLINSFIANTQNAMMGLVLICSGLPLYFYWKYKK